MDANSLTFTNQGLAKLATWIILTSTTLQIEPTNINIISIMQLAIALLRCLWNKASNEDFVAIVN